MEKNKKRERKVNKNLRNYFYENQQQTYILCNKKKNFCFRDTKIATNCSCLSDEEFRFCVRQKKEYVFAEV